MTTGAIILFGLAIVFIVIGVALAIHTKVVEYLFLLFFAFTFFLLGLAEQCPIPNDNDVKEGTAHYVEQTHIEVVNDDTVNIYKTYQIEWIENFK